MAKDTRKLTTKNFSIAIGFILIIQVLQVQQCSSVSVHNITRRSAERFLYEEPSFSEDLNDQETAITTKFHRIGPKMPQPFGMNSRTNFHQDEWKAVTFNKRNNFPTLKHEDRNPHFDDAPVQEPSDEGRMVFPDESIIQHSQVRSSYNQHTMINPTCENSVLCENVPNYPHDLVEDRLAAATYFKIFQSRDEIVGVSNRIGGNADDPLCRSTEEVKYPQAGVTRDDEVKYIVNGENFVQAVRVEICTNENSPCRLINGFASGYGTMCEQKYIYRQLIGIQNDGTLAPEYFKIPSSCCCHVQFNGNAWERMATGFRFSPKRN